MKTLLFLIPALVLMQACGNNSQSVATSETKTTTPIATTPAPVAEPETPDVVFAKKTSQAIQGQWRSTIDTKSEIKIEGDDFIDIYGGKKLLTSQISYSVDCSITDCKQGPKDCFMVLDKTNALCYFITKLTADEFQYTMVGGKSQSFKRVK